MSLNIDHLLTPPVREVLLKTTVEEVGIVIGALSPDLGDFEFRLQGHTVNLTVDDQERLDRLVRMDLGVFVTLKTKPNMELRGCIGYIQNPEPFLELVPRAARAAALQDPRFPPVEADEFDSLHISLSILGPNEELTGDRYEYPSQVTIGLHGLVIELGFQRGLLLPQVATDYNLDSATFLDWTCRKAGLSSDCWKNPKTRVFKFEGIEIE